MAINKKMELLKSAGKCFAKKGLTNTKISDITDLSGVGKGTFYLYFKNKKDIFLALVDSLFLIFLSGAGI